MYWKNILIFEWSLVAEMNHWGFFFTFEFHLPTSRHLQTLEKGFSLYGCSDENPETVDIIRMFQGFTNRCSSFLGTQSDVFIDDAAHLLPVEMHPNFDLFRCLP